MPSSLTRVVAIVVLSILLIGGLRRDGAFLRDATSKLITGMEFRLSFILEKNNSGSDILSETSSLGEKSTSTVYAQAVDCQLIKDIPPVNIGRMSTIPDARLQYLVSFSWWDIRLRKGNFKRGKAVKSNPSVIMIQRLLLESREKGAFIDVGANVGFMANYATCLLDKRVYAIDPISYNIAKLCEGYRANILEGFARNDSLYLYHAAAGPEELPLINITRPSNQAGFFDRSSLSRVNILSREVVQESIPMITIDSIIPESVPISVVKIDVQGHEYGVLQGMTRILSRKVGYPIYVFFEDDEKLTNNSGFVPGASAQLLTSFGYNCSSQKGDTLCTKP
jgi:FkbM family methyltransferase